MAISKFKCIIHIYFVENLRNTLQRVVQKQKKITNIWYVFILVIYKNITEESNYSVFYPQIINHPSQAPFQNHQIITIKSQRHLQFFVLLSLKYLFNYIIDLLTHFFNYYRRFFLTCVWQRILYYVKQEDNIYS